MADTIERKRVTLHPLNKDGSLDLNTNLYPKTFLDGIVDREGNEVSVQEKLIAGTNVTINNNVISATGGVTKEELQEALANTSKIAEVELTDLLDDSSIESLNNFLTGEFTDETHVSFPFKDGVVYDLSDLEGFQTLSTHSLVNVNKQYKFIAPGPNDRGVVSGLYWDLWEEGTDFPSSSIISQFLYSNVTIPVPQDVDPIRGNGEWYWKVYPQVLYPSNAPEPINPPLLLNTSLSNISSPKTITRNVNTKLDSVDNSVGEEYIVLWIEGFGSFDNYPSTLRSDGWEVSLEHNAYVGEFSFEDIYVATKDGVEIRFAQDGDCGEFIIRELNTQNNKYLLVNYMYETASFNQDILNEYLANTIDFPLPPHDSWSDRDYWQSGIKSYAEDEELWNFTPINDLLGGGVSNVFEYDFATMTTLGDEKDNISLTNQYASLLSDNGWEVSTISSDNPLMYEAVRGDIKMRFVAFSNNFLMGINDNRTRSYSIENTLYFRNTKTEGLPVFEYMSVANNNLVELLLTDSSIDGNLVVASKSKSSGDFRVLELCRYIPVEPEEYSYNGGEERGESVQPLGRGVGENTREVYYNLEGGYTTNFSNIKNSNSNYWWEYSFRGDLMEYIYSATGSPLWNVSTQQKYSSQYGTWYDEYSWEEKEPKELPLVLVQLYDGIHLGKLCHRYTTYDDWYWDGSKYILDNENAEPYSPDNPEVLFIYFTEDSEDIYYDAWNPNNAIKFVAHYLWVFNPNNGNWEYESTPAFWEVYVNYESAKELAEEAHSRADDAYTQGSNANIKFFQGIAPSFNYNNYYSKGDLVTYNNFIYRWQYSSSLKNKYPSGSSTSNTYWEYVTLKTLLGSAGGVWGTITGNLSNQTDLQNALNNKANSSDLTSNVTTLTNSINDLAKNLAPEWSNSHGTYYKGDVVLYSNNLYECILEHSSSSYYPTNTTYWKRTNIIDSTLGLLTEAM